MQAARKINTEMTSLIRYNCEVCKDTGMEIYEEVDTETYGKPVKITVGRPCPACSGGLKANAERNKQLSGIPDNCIDSTMEDFDFDLYGQNMRALQKATSSFITDFEEWESRSMGMYFFSETKGSGKTFLSCCLANEIMERYGKRAKFIRCADILNRIQQDDDEGKHNLIDILSNTDLLILDDLGSRRAVDWLNDVLFRIIDARMALNKPILVTSNMDFDGLRKMNIDERVLDRLYNATYVIQLPEVSIRQQIARKKKTDFFNSLIS